MVSIDLFFKKKRAKTPNKTSSKIKLAGVDNLKPFQKSSLESTMNNALAKFEKNYGNVKNFKCHIKVYEEGKRGRVKYSIHLKLTIPGSSFVAEQANFTFSTAVSWAMKALEKEVLRKKEKYRSRSRKGSGRRKVYEKEILQRARGEKLKKFKIRGIRRKLGKVFPPLVKR